MEKTKDGDEIAFITKNKDGNYYVGIKIKVKRGIKGKTKSKVDELLIIGMKKEAFEKWKKQSLNLTTLNTTQ